MRITLTALVFLSVFIGATWSPDAHALQFTPTDAEWRNWPEYCRARYVVSGKGRGSGRQTEVSEATVAAWEARMGPNAWHGLHHHCAALAYLQRGLKMPPGVEREGMMQASVRNHEYMLKGTPPQHFIYPDVMANLAGTYSAWGKPTKASETLSKAVAAQPTAPMPYLIKARMYRDSGKTKEARDTLLAADSATEGKSAEIKYALGVDYFKSNDLSLAQQYARDAYALGYPLPWLREQLARKGFSVDPLPAPQ